MVDVRELSPNGRMDNSYFRGNWCCFWWIMKTCWLLSGCVVDTRQTERCISNFPQNIRKKRLETYIEVHPIFHGHSWTFWTSLTFPKVFLFLRDLYTNIVWILVTKIRHCRLRGVNTNVMITWKMNQYESTIINDNGGKTMSSTTHLGMVHTTYKNGDDWGMMRLWHCFTNSNHNSQQFWHSQISHKKSSICFTLWWILMGVWSCQPVSSPSLFYGEWMVFRISSPLVSVSKIVAGMFKDVNSWPQIWYHLSALIAFDP